MIKPALSAQLSRIVAVMKGISGLFWSEERQARDDARYERWRTKDRSRWRYAAYPLGMAMGVGAVYAWRAGAVLGVIATCTWAAFGVGLFRSERRSKN